MEQEQFKKRVGPKDSVIERNINFTLTKLKHGYGLEITMPGRAKHELKYFKTRQAAITFMEKY